jgi:hypothetical protein
MMSHKERFKTAVKLGQPDLVPINALLDPIPVEKITGKRTLGGGIETQAITEYGELSHR